MRTPQEHIVNALRQLAAGATSGLEFSVESLRSRGTPLLWEERISIQQGHQQRYSTIRSFVDASGAPIGIWEAPAEAKTIQELAKALCETRIWELSSEPLISGGEINSWSYEISEEKATLSVPGGSPVLMAISDVDLQLRRIANALVASRSGAALSCQLKLTELSGGWVNAQIALINEGKQDCLVQNPLIISGRKTDFLRIELGEPPIQQPEMTSAGIQYQPLPIQVPSDLPPPWNGEYIVLHSGKRIDCPLKGSVNVSEHRGYFIRAVYSHYGRPTITHEVPLVRGRVFSAELQL